MRIRILFLFVFYLLFAQWAYAAETEQKVKVIEPYLEMHTGPGAGFPVFNVVERGGWITILKRRADWFMVRTQKGKTGWVDRKQMEQTVTASGNRVRFRDITQDEFSERLWEMGMTGGQFANAPVLSLYGGYAFSKNLSTELTLAHVLGDISSSTFLKLNLLAQPFPEWRYSPFFSIGTGYIKTRPNSRLVQALDRSNQFSQIGIGLRAYLTRRFILRMEYNGYVLYSANNENDQNEEIREWKAGFTVFF